MDLDEASFVEKPVNGSLQGVAHPEDGAESARSRSQVGDGAKKLEGVPFLLQGITIGDRSQERDLLRPEFHLLAGRRRLDESPADPDRCTSGDALQMEEALRIFIDYDLKVVHRGTVTERKKGYPLPLSRGTDPSLRCHVFLWNN
jgi:hypothetical protein